MVIFMEVNNRSLILFQNVNATNQKALVLDVAKSCFMLLSEFLILQKIFITAIEPKRKHKQVFSCLV